MIVVIDLVIVVYKVVLISNVINTLRSHFYFGLYSGVAFGLLLSFVRL
jgi:hypothetical protein